MVFAATPTIEEGRAFYADVKGRAARIGRNAAECEVAIDDPFTSPRHATVHHTPRGWVVENSGANGLWVRIEAPLRLSVASQFLCGEQRFVFVPLVT